MTDDDACKACGRSRRSALTQEPVERCHDRFNQTAGRCLWHAARQRPAAASATASAPASAPAPATSTPATSTPTTSTPTTSTPTTSAPATSAPAASAPATSAPAASTPATSAPATSTPATSAPATSAPAASAPSTSAPPAPAPAASTPAASTPATSTPATSTPATSAPATSAPAASAAATSAPAASAPAASARPAPAPPDAPAPGPSGAPAPTPPAPSAVGPDAPGDPPAGAAAHRDAPAASPTRRDDPATGSAGAPRPEAAASAAAEALAARLASAEAEVARLRHAADEARRERTEAVDAAARRASAASDDQAATLRRQAEEAAAAHARASAEATRHRTLAEEATAARDLLAREVQRLEAVVSDVAGQRDAAPTHDQLAAVQGANAGLQRDVEGLRLKLRDLLAAAGSALPGTIDGPRAATATIGRLRRTVEWLIVSRLRLGSLSAVVGMLLGAGGLGAWDHGTRTTDRPPAAATASAAGTNGDRQAVLASTGTGNATGNGGTGNGGIGNATGNGGGQASQASAAPSAAGSRPIDPAMLRERLTRALGAENMTADIEVSKDLARVTIDVRPLPAAQRLAAAAVVRAALAGAGLGGSVVESVIGDTPDAQVSSATGGPGNRRPARPPVKDVAGRQAPVPADAGATTGREPATGGGPKRGGEASTASTPPTPAGSVRDQDPACLRSKATSRFSPLYSLYLYQCMRRVCCDGKRRIDSEECRTYNETKPLNCEAPY